jgi:hypothetical protein
MIDNGSIIRISPEIHTRQIHCLDKQAISLVRIDLSIQISKERIVFYPFLKKIIQGMFLALYRDNWQEKRKCQQKPPEDNSA